MSTDVELAGSIDIDVNPFINSMKRADTVWTTGTDNFTKAFSSIGSFADRSMLTVQNAMSSIVQPLADLTTKVFEVGAAFDDSFDKIRIATGATGAAFTGLQDSFRNVASGVPSTFGDISTALAELSQRTNQTGADLEAMATTQLNLARLTGGDLSTQIQKTTRLFGDWSIATAGQVPALDMLLKASQATGIEVNSLASSLVRYGAPLREMGFSFEQASAMMGKFEKEGVNLDMVLSGMKMSLGKMAKAGIEPVAGLEMLIQKIKDAGSAAEANSIGVKVFGLRAGVDMVRAIKEGRFELGAMVSQIASSSETINKAAGDTADFAESWVLFKNKLMLAIEPLSGDLFSGLNSLIPSLQPVVDMVKNAVEWFGKLPDAVKQTTLIFGGLSVAAVAVAPVIGAIGAAIGALSLPVIAIGAGIALFASAYVGNWGGIRDKVNALVGDLTKLYQDHKVQIDAVVEGVGDALKLVAKLWADNVASTIDNIRLLVRVVDGDYRGAWELASQISKENAEKSKQDADQLKQWLGEKWTGIKTQALDIWEGIKTGLGKAWENIKSIASSTWNGIVNFFGSIPERIGYFLGNLAGRIVSFFTDSKESSSTSAAGLVDGVINWFAKLPGRAVTFFSNLANSTLEWFGKAKTWAIDTVTKLYDGAKEWLGKVPELVTGAWDSVLTYLSGIPDKIYDKLKQIGASMLTGYKDGSDTKSPSGIEKLIFAMSDNISAKLEKMIGEHGEKAKKHGKAISDGFKQGLGDINELLGNIGGGLQIDEDIAKRLGNKTAKDLLAMSKAFKAHSDATKAWAIELAVAFKRANSDLEVSIEGGVIKIREGTAKVISHVEALSKSIPPMVITTIFKEIDSAAFLEATKRTGQDFIKLQVEGFDAAKAASEKYQGELAKQGEENKKIILDSARETYGKLADLVGDGLASVLAQVSKFSGISLKKLGDTASGIVEVFTNIPGKLGNKLKSITETVLSWINSIDKALGGLHKIFNNIPDGLGGVIQSVVGIFKNNNATNQVGSAIGGLVNGATQAASGAATAAGQAAGGAVSGGVASGITAGTSSAVSALGGIFGALTQAVSVFASTFHDDSKSVRFAGGFLVGGIIGGTLAAIFGGPSDFEKAKRELQLDQMKANIASVYEDIKAKMVDVMTQGQALLEAISVRTDTPRKAIKRFINQLGLMLELFIDESKRLAPMGMEAAKAVTDNLGGAFDFMIGAVDLSKAIKGMEEASEIDVKALGNSTTKLLNGIFAVMADVELSVAKQSGKKSDRLKPIIDLVTAIPNAIKAAIETPEISLDQITAAFASARKFIDGFFAFSEELIGYALNKTSKAAGQLGGIFDTGQSMFEFLKVFTEYTPVADNLATINSDFAAISSWMDSTENYASKWNTQGDRINGYIQGMVSALKSGWGALGSISGGLGGATSSLTLQAAGSGSFTSGLSYTPRASDGASAASRGGTPVQNTTIQHNNFQITMSLKDLEELANAPDRLRRIEQMLNERHSSTGPMAQSRAAY